MSLGRVLIHSIGPNGVYADVMDFNEEKFKVKYYDARDGGDLVRWVYKTEVAIMSGDFSAKKEEAMGKVKTSVSRSDVDTLITSIFVEHLKLCEIQNNYGVNEILSDNPREFVIGALERLAATCSSAAQDFRLAQTDEEWRSARLSLAMPDDPDMFYNMAREDEANGWP